MGFRIWSWLAIFAPPELPVRGPRATRGSTPIRPPVASEPRPFLIILQSPARVPTLDATAMVALIALSTLRRRRTWQRLYRPSARQYGLLACFCLADPRGRAIAQRGRSTRPEMARGRGSRLIWLKAPGRRVAYGLFWGWLMQYLHLPQPWRPWPNEDRSDRGRFGCARQIPFMSRGPLLACMESYFQ